ncbi:MAG: hypothetical protein MUD14_19735 [Hydrococcus sp. Prado102]|jgi:hypothetical protein|nr:hypothetical protein [Hydrococcus sp. Prado102]
MAHSTQAEKTLLCPSARPEGSNSVVFGVVGGAIEQPDVKYLPEPQPVTEELIALASPVTPTEVFRIAADCATSQCQHFDGQNCRLAQRIVTQLPTVAEQLPPCAIRRDCRWFQQEGKAACMRCPQIITDNATPSELMRPLSIPST